MIKISPYFSLLLIAVAICFSNKTLAQHSLSIRLNNIPANTAADNIFAAGNFNGWNPADDAYRFSKNANGQWELTIPNLSSGNYEFKFTRGSWEKVACAASGTDIPNYVLQLTSDSTMQFDVEAWKDNFASAPKKHTATANVSIIDTAFYIPQLDRKRRIWIYLPQDYAQSKKRYPVLYMHDGQNVFDELTSGFGEWGVDECLDSLSKSNRYQCIVVGIDNGPKRLNEYNPFYNERFGEGEGDAYAKFIAYTLKPFIDSSYRTLKDRRNTIIAGSSMGGLISYYAAIKYPEVFGKAGIFSPAFWTAEPGINNLTDSLARKINGKFFFFMGGQEGDEYMNDMFEVMQSLATNSSALMYAAIDPDGKHNEATWRKWFPEFLKFIMADWTNYIIDTTE